MSVHSWSPWLLQCWDREHTQQTLAYLVDERWCFRVATVRKATNVQLSSRPEFSARRPIPSPFPEYSESFVTPCSNPSGVCCCTAAAAWGTIAERIFEVKNAGRHHLPK